MFNLKEKLDWLKQLITKRMAYILYTLRHKVAFLKVEKQLRGRYTWRGLMHDMDKPFLYMALWKDVSEIQVTHRNHSKHHVKNNLKKSEEDLLDTIIDWECARMTKPDKPLNAYETLMKFYPSYQAVYLPIIRKHLPYQITDKSKIKE
ncbi:MAG: hypothetical protein IJO11_02115 [Alphaproteobacteria bacterium]|nr:hypothetical protein [Alphaproteobacteria bacterium]MBQ6854220.1 hypothetical protein [Alphaproteobacteria bacterium]MBQ8558070.1 hypothetical protein [Alphaproteobacteria bacterium]MBR3912989.1 hypothetical protein [Alphaproteobacteria bacterium]